MEIIAVTGTKGKTTVTRVLSGVIHALERTTLRVDTDGHYINEQQQSTLEDSKALFSLVPTVCPGKYLIEMKNFFPDFTAILEAALGSSSAAGLGYGSHQIGIFLNVFEDHLGVTARLKKRIDLAKAKNFIFSRVADNGFVIFNADDKYVCSQLKMIPEGRTVHCIPVGKKFSHFNVTEHLNGGGVCITHDGENIIIRSKEKDEVVINMNKIPWTFGGSYSPSIWNLMFIVAGLYAYGGKNFSDAMRSALEKYRLDSEGGRLTMLKNDAGVHILVDYAHEKYSLIEIAKLAKKIGKRTIGVIRLAPDRTNEMISETGEAVANKFNDIVVYDKIDGVSKMKYEGKKQKIVRHIGEVSQILFDSISKAKKRGTVSRIIVEDDAVRKASEIAKPGDVVVVICGDNHKATIASVEKYFKAHLA